MFWETVIFLLVTAKHGQSLRSYSFQPLQSLDGRQGQGPLLNVTTPSRLECSFLCVAHPDCMAFSYEPSSRRCHVHWRPSPTEGDPLAGMKTYRLPRCRKTCLPGWILHLCTLCLQPVTSSLAFHPAVQRCKDMGGELQKWRTTAEYRAYMDFIFTDFNSYQDMWIGASDEVKEGTFLWHDGTPAGIPWKAEFGEPRGGAAEDCVFVGMGTYQMSPTFVVVSPAFQDTSCSGARKFVCVFFGEEL